MPGLSCFAVIHRLAIHSAAAAYLSSERCAVNCAGIDFLSNVVVPLGRFTRLMGSVRVMVIFLQLQEPIRQGVTVFVQGFTSVCGSVSTGIGLLIHPNGIAVYNVIDQNVTNGGGSSRIVGFDVPGIVRIVQVTTVYSQSGWAVILPV